MLRLILLLCVLSVPAAVQAQISIRTALSDDRRVAPGTTYDGVVEVWNETDVIQQAKVYQTDYRFFADGTNVYGEPGSEPRSNALWTQVSAGTITIPPQQSVPVNYRVAVPESVNGAEPEGSYWSMIMVEAVPPESPESTINPENGEPEYYVLQIMRYGIQVATHIRGTGGPSLNITGSELKLLDGGQTALQVLVENQGTRMIRPEVWVEVYAEDGSALGKHDGVQNRIYPGTSVRQEIGLGTLAPGRYRALVIFDGGGEDVFGAEYNLEVN
ncbi:MAG: hypothetical protein JJ896_05400 [Rhodothermales bacterium]|nr:hypothetical protein [Rhodothermales bacterium]MBO6779070.1 hypothetical protein [Rhodothermales bacterium]